MSGVVRSVGTGGHAAAVLRADAGAADVNR
jgi:hypothetical protein